jgi:aryl-alcohol dehydrogenase-like predicted oxidoreductase
MTTQTVKRVLEYGVNFFDTSEVYDRGKAETCLGNTFKILKVRREEIVVSVKVFQETMSGGHPNSRGLSRKHIIEGVKNSLRRLQLDYADVVFAHRPDLHTPLEETCRAFSWLIDQGLAFYWGTSEWTPARVTEAIELCKRLNLNGPVAE